MSNPVSVLTRSFTGDLLRLYLVAVGDKRDACRQPSPISSECKHS